MAEEICLQYLNLAAGAAGLNLSTLPDDGFAPGDYTPTDAFAKGHVEGIDNALNLINNGSLVQTGGVDPTVVAPDFIGQIYINTVNETAFAAHSLVVGDWIALPMPVLRTVLGGNGISDNIGDNRATPGPNTVDAALDGQTNLGSEPAISGGPDYGTGADYATVSGGRDSLADAVGATVIGGIQNAARGTSSIAGGQTATANGNSSVVLGTGAASVKGDSIDPFAAVNAVALGGSTVYGNESLGAGTSRAWGDSAVAFGKVTDAVGNHSLAQGTNTGGLSTVAGGNESLAIGDGADASGERSVAIGTGVVTGEFGTRAATISISGPDTDLIIAGEDLTSRVLITQRIRLFDFSGGGFDPNVDANVIDDVIDAIVFAASTTITLNGVNIAPATACRIAFVDQAPHAFAMGDSSRAFDPHAFAFGDSSIAEGLHSHAEGRVAVTLGDYAYATGELVNAFADHSRATGKSSQTRNKGERAHATDQYAGIEWSQERVILLYQEVPTGSATLAMFTDDQAGGTEEIITFTDHAYQVRAMVLGLIDVAGVATTAAFELLALFKNDSGTLTQIGVTTVTTIANEDGVKFDVNPVFAISGTNIRINVANDGSVTDPVRWMARVLMLELGV